MNSYSAQQSFSNPKFIHNQRDKSQGSSSQLNKSVSSKSNQCFNEADCQKNIQLYINDLKRLANQKLQKPSEQKPAQRERSNTSKNRLSVQPSHTNCTELNKSNQNILRESQSRTNTAKKKDVQTKPYQTSTASKRTSEILRKYVNALDVTSQSDAQSTSILNSGKNESKQSLLSSKRDSKDAYSVAEKQKRSNSMTNFKRTAPRDASLNISYSSKHIAQRKSVVEKINQTRSSSQSAKNSKTSTTSVKTPASLQNYSQNKRDADKENQARVSRSRIANQQQPQVKSLQANQNVCSTKQQSSTQILKYQISPSHVMTESKVTYSNPFSLQQLSTQKINNETQSIIDLQQCTSPFNNSHCKPHQPSLQQVFIQSDPPRSETTPLVMAYQSLESKLPANPQKASQTALIDLSKELEDLNFVRKRGLDKSQSVVSNEGQNIEEMHYQFVNFFQRSRQMLHEIEGAAATLRTRENDCETNRLLLVEEITIE